MGIRMPVPGCRHWLLWSFAYAPLSLTFALPQLSLEALLRGRTVGDSADVHNPEYNFNDDAIPVGCSWWAEIAERRMPAA